MAVNPSNRVDLLLYGNLDGLRVWRFYCKTECNGSN
jgi:hypothetical protein